MHAVNLAVVWVAGVSFLGETTFEIWCRSSKWLSNESPQYTYFSAVIAMKCSRSVWREKPVEDCKIYCRFPSPFWAERQQKKRTIVRIVCLPVPASGCFIDEFVKTPWCELFAHSSLLPSVLSLRPRLKSAATPPSVVCHYFCHWLSPPAAPENGPKLHAASARLNLRSYCEAIAKKGALYACFSGRILAHFMINFVLFMGEQGKCRRRRRQLHPMAGAEPATSAWRVWFSLLAGSQG